MSSSRECGAAALIMVLFITIGILGFTAVSVDTVRMQVSTRQSQEDTCSPLLLNSQDLNFDGDAQDNLGNESMGVDLKLVPMQFEIAYDNGGWERSLRYFRLITRTAN